MRVLLAGATGAIGRPLLKRLLAAGHEVVATTRSAESAEQLTAQGAEGVVLDAFDAEAVHRVVGEARPEVVLHQLTSLPADISPKAMKASIAVTNKLRRVTVPTFVNAAREAGARRIVVQSISFVTEPTGPAVVDETAPLWTNGPRDIEPVIQTISDMERAALSVEGIETLVLRYGFFYGPGTWYDREGTMGRMIAKRQYPMFGDSGGVWSWIHVDDAADATVRALDRGEPGVYNITDDEPVALSEWLPVVVDALGAKPPRRLPTWLVRRVAGNAVVYYGTMLRGASNAKARAALGYEPRPWREALPEAFRA